MEHQRSTPAPGEAAGADSLTDFDRFYRDQFRPLVAFAYGLSGSASLAEDLAHDALLAAFDDWAHVGSLEKPAAWVRRVVANRAVSSFRRRLVEATALATRLRVRDGDASAAALPPESAHVWAAIRRLPRRQAQVITLRTLDRSSLAEIADVLGISEESASTHLRRARKTLGRQLTREDLA